MPKVTKILGNNKARAWESLGFAHKKRLCQHFDTTSSYLRNFYFLTKKLLFHRQGTFVPRGRNKMEQVEA